MNYEQLVVTQQAAFDYQLPCSPSYTVSAAFVIQPEEINLVGLMSQSALAVCSVAHEAASFCC